VEVAACLMRHHAAVLRLLQHGLHRGARAADAGVRARAWIAARSLHRAGLGHPGSMAEAVFAPLFAHVGLRRGLGAMLHKLAQQDCRAVACALAAGVRRAFAALLWQAPQQLALSGSQSLVRSAFEASRAFGASGGQSRARWLRVLLKELQSLDAEDFVARFPGLPSGPTHGAAAAPVPFRLARKSRPGGGKGALCALPGHGDGGAAWATDERLPLLYGNFLAHVLAALPLTPAEATGLTEQCVHYLELKVSAASSACEHDSAEPTAQSLFPLCASALLSVSLVDALATKAQPQRPAALQAAVGRHAPALLTAAGDRAAGLARWLENVADAGGQPPSGKRRRGADRGFSMNPSGSSCPASPRRRS